MWSVRQYEPGAYHRVDRRPEKDPKAPRYRRVWQIQSSYLALSDALRKSVRVRAACGTACTAQRAACATFSVQRARGWMSATRAHSRGEARGSVLYAARVRGGTRGGTRGGRRDTRSRGGEARGSRSGLGGWGWVCVTLCGAALLLLSGNAWNRMCS